MNTITEYDRTWPFQQRRAFDVSATIQYDDKDTAQKRAAKLRQLGFDVEVQPVAILELSPEDQAEKEALEAAIAGGAK
jgi:hypothetical protein